MSPESLPANTHTYQTDADSNQLLSDGVFTYSYDNEGNRKIRWVASGTNETQPGTGDSNITVYTWDNRNRLTKVTHYATYEDYSAATPVPDKTVSYVYDYLNRWIGETVVAGGVTKQTRFVYDGNQIVLEFDKTGSGNLAAGDLSHRYLWGPAVDQLMADEQIGDTVVWPLADGEGTLRDLATYDSGIDVTTIATHRVYNGFGVLKSTLNPTVDCLFGYTGRAFDKDGGLQNNGARWYEAITGRWLSEDPAGFAAGDANLYRYVGNNPTILVDPSGLAGMSGMSGGGMGGGVTVGCGCGGYAVLAGYDLEDIDGKGPAENDATFFAVPLCVNGCGGNHSDAPSWITSDDPADPWKDTYDSIPLWTRQNVAGLQVNSPICAGMGNYYDLPKKFWGWYHRQEKPKGGGPPDLPSREDAQKWYKIWVEEGEPDAEGHRTRPPGYEPDQMCAAALAGILIGDIIADYGWIAILAF